MERRLPPLNALHAFEAAARHESFSQAAKELHVTHAAVSHQVKALEVWLGVQLFDRTARAVRLNERGRAYLPLVRGVFDQLHTGTATLLRASREEALIVTAPPAFAVRWLAPRIGRLWSAHPDLGLRLKEMSWLEEVDFTATDVAIRVGDDDPPDLETVPLLPGTVTPMCSPMLLANGHPLNAPGDLVHYTLLHAYDHDGWREWFRAAGLNDAHAGSGPVFDDTNLIHSATLAGQGIGLLHTALTRKELAAGLLVRPFEIGPENNLGYHLVYPRGSASDHRIARFRDWLLKQAAEEEN